MPGARLDPMRYSLRGAMHVGARSSACYRLAGRVAIGPSIRHRQPDTAIDQLIGVLVLSGHERRVPSPKTETCLEVFVTFRSADLAVVLAQTADRLATGRHRRIEPVRQSSRPGRAPRAVRTPSSGCTLTHVVG
jgi:hypothetical protein